MKNMDTLTIFRLFLLRTSFPQVIFEYIIILVSKTKIYHYIDQRFPYKKLNGKVRSLVRI